MDLNIETPIREAMMHDYGLTWIDNEKLFQVSVDVFKGVFSTKKTRIPEDPFLVVAHGGIAGIGFAESLKFEEARRINRSLSNAIGNWHQHVLGLGEGWRDMEVGQGFDLHYPGEHPEFGGPVIVEVKNKFNTIKASDEAKIWRDLYAAWKTLLGRKGNAYLIQINSKDSERYDRPWEPSGVAKSENVRVCDGATAYERIFGQKDALFELFNAFSFIITDVVKHYDQSVELTNEDVKAIEKWGRPLIP